MGSAPSKSKKKGKTKDDKDSQQEGSASTPEKPRRRDSIQKRTTRRASAVPGLDTIRDDPDEESADEWIFGSSADSIAVGRQTLDVSDHSVSSRDNRRDFTRSEQPA